MELHQDLLKGYNVLMRKGDDECWTQTEAKSELGAMNLCNLRWKKPWRAVEARFAAPFHQVLDAGTEEEEIALTQLRRQNLINAKNKAVITPKGEFPSIEHALSEYGTRHQLKTLMKNHPTEYYFKAK